MLRNIFLLILFFCTTITNASQMKAALLYVGPHDIASGEPSEVTNPNLYSFWSSSDINKLNTVNTFIISPIGNRHGYKYSSYQWGVNNPWLDNSSTYYNYSRYLLDVRQTIAAIYNSNNSNASIYISLPRYRDYWSGEGKTRYYTLEKARAFLTDLKLNVTAASNSNYWNTNIKGLYMIEETYDGCAVANQPDYCSGGTTFDDDFNYFKNIRKVINSEVQKELIWAPQYNIESTTWPKLSELLKWQNNNSIIFDYILMQPGYNPNGCLSCFTDIKNRLSSQAVSGVSSGQAKLGVVMEILPNLDRYNEYVCHLNSYYFNNNDFTFYFDARKKLETVVDDINSFYSGAAVCN